MKHKSLLRSARQSFGGQGMDHISHFSYHLTIHTNHESQSVDHERLSLFMLKQTIDQPTIKPGLQLETWSLYAPNINLQKTNSASRRDAKSCVS